MSKPFIVQTDASDVAMGAVLLQEIEGKRHVVAYASQKFSKSEVNYSTTEKEAYAVYWALSKRFRHYLFFGQFVLETDHKALKFLKESVKNSNNSRLLKWSLLGVCSLYYESHPRGRKLGSRCDEPSCGKNRPSRR